MQTTVCINIVQVFEKISECTVVKMVAIIVFPLMHIQRVLKACRVPFTGRQ